MSTPRTQRGSIARRMWYVNFNNASPRLYSSKLIAERVIGSEFDRFKAYPVAVLDIRPEAVEEMVLRVEDALWGHPAAASLMHRTTMPLARAALAAILPLPRTRKRRE